VLLEVGGMVPLVTSPGGATFSSAYQDGYRVAAPRYRKPVEDLGLASLAMHVVAANFPAIEEED